MNNGLNKGLLVLAVSSITIFGSLTATAGVADMKNSSQARAYSTVNASTSVTTPKFQNASAPAISWSPKVNLDNASGKPAINLDKANGSPYINLTNASGNIKSTSGVSNDIKTYIDDKLKEGGGSGGSVSGWSVVYDDATGTRELTPQGGWNQFKIYFKCYTYTGTGQNASWKTGSGSGYLSASVTAVGATATQTRSQKCGGDNYSATASATAKLTFSVGNSISAPASADDTDSARGGSCVSAYAESHIRNFVITKMEAYYP
ncbi:hypothetical protein [Vibrio sp.]|uniref:hypothetical protein n=1 Tax=Vibrio sp. TaxID=678 RepID=UPI003D10B11A